ncbi:MAG: acyl-CoA dehydrogenase family protein [Bryobacteraceae bacterium]|nr:acyl-CoA dehydrogenase family protein [Bryobacteraceae bacterium]
MLDLELTEDQRSLQNAAIEFARSRLECPDIARRDRDEEFHREGWRQCAEFGVLAMPVPETYGGLGHGPVDMIAAMEGLGYATRDQGLLFSINAHLWTNSIPILAYGTEEQKRKYLPRLSTGELIGANAASEPEAGSDIFSMRTRAERRGDCYVLNGAKTFVSNAPVAGLFVTYATINPSLGALGVTAFLVERDTPGLHVGRPMEKMGLRTSPMAEVVFDNCEIPLAQRLGREGRGVAVFESSMEWERGCILANCLGVMRRQLEECIGHVRARRQFGKPIGKFQSVANRIVDMKVRLETSRPMVYRIGRLKERNLPAMLEAAVAKLYVSDCYVKSCLDAIQIHGGYGYMTEQLIELELRNAVGSSLYSGTTEIQRNIIAAALRL